MIMVIICGASLIVQVHAYANLVATLHLGLAALLLLISLGAFMLEYVAA